MLLLRSKWSYTNSTTKKADRRKWKKVITSSNRNKKTT
ncbi:hypothetical protein WCLE_010280 [Wolbachia endosymbiont of Cimex lectularius]|nr:hypothetical protein WCLE_010280 [Wolbachia endosymbiont of Cimex lectularius]